MGRIEEYCAQLPTTVCYVQERVMGRGVISIYWTSIISSHLVLPSTSLPSFQHRKISCKRHKINYNQSDKQMSSVIWLLFFKLNVSMLLSLISVGMPTVFKVRKSQICKFLGSFRYHKFANFLGVPICKSQIRKKNL